MSRSQYGPDKGSGSENTWDILPLPSKYPDFTVRGSSAGKQMLLTGFEVGVINVEELSKVRSKGSMIGRKRKKAREEGTKKMGKISGWKWKARLSMDILVLFLQLLAT